MRILPVESKMKFCPECDSEIEATDAQCPHCGYDLPEPERTTPWYYSSLAMTALAVASLMAVLGCVLSVFGSIGLLFQGEFLRALFLGPIAFFYQLAMLILFMRTLDEAQKHQREE